MRVAAMGNWWFWHKYLINRLYLRSIGTQPPRGISIPIMTSMEIGRQQCVQRMGWRHVPLQGSVEVLLEAARDRAAISRSGDSRRVRQIYTWSTRGYSEFMTRAALTNSAKVFKNIRWLAFFYETKNQKHLSNITTAFFVCLFVCFTQCWKTAAPKGRVVSQLSLSRRPSHAPKRYLHLSHLNKTLLRFSFIGLDQIK